MGGEHHPLKGTPVLGCKWACVLLNPNHIHLWVRWCCHVGILRCRSGGAYHSRIGAVLGPHLEESCDLFFHG